jgi:arylsulfatase A-like enzyme
VLVASLLLSAGETTFAWAMRWHHRPAYFLVCGALTLALGLALGVVATPLCTRVSWSLAAWAAAAAGLVDGGAVGLGVALGGALACWVPALARASIGLLAVSASAGLTLALSVGDALGYAPLGAGLFFAATLAAPAWIAARLPARIPRAPVTLAVALVFFVSMAWPTFHMPDGTRRLPRPTDLESRSAGGVEKPHVFLIVLDTVRADRLSVYGSARRTTPELEAWVARRPNAVVVPNVHANGAWTVPSHGSLFTGRLPNEHGAHFALDGSLSVRFGLSEKVPRLAQAMKDAGYATLGTFANNWLKVVQGMDAGFDRLFRSPHAEPLPFAGEALRARLVPGACLESQKGGARSAAVSRTLLSMIEPWSQGPNPLYAFANYGDAHGPYAPMPGFLGRFRPADLATEPGHLSIHADAERRAELADRYDEEILYMDHELGALLAELERLGVLDRAWVFITSDHGEAFGEHGATEHGTTVHDEVTRIPLIVFPPQGVELAPPAGSVSLVDVAATIAAIGGADLGGPGRDLRRAAAGETLAVGEFYGDARKAKLHGELAARPGRFVVLDGRWKLIALGDKEPLETHLYDLQADPGETHDLAGERPDLVARLRTHLPPFSEPIHATGPIGRSDMHALQGLGYVSSDDEPPPKPKAPADREAQDP